MSRIRRREEDGSVFVTVALFMASLIAFGALAIDTGRARSRKVDAQATTDFTALAAVEYLPSATLQTNSRHVARANGLRDSAETYPDTLTVTCGVWSEMNSTFTACSNATSAPCTACTDSIASAVRAEVLRPVESMLARIFRADHLDTWVESIATKTPPSSVCVRPIGVTRTTLQPQNTPLAPGQTFTISRETGGNWMKLDIGSQMSSGTNFRNAMLSLACPGTTAIGTWLSQGTGFGGSVRRVFGDLGDSPDRATLSDMIIPVVTPLQNGNGDVQVLEFVRAKYLSQSGNGAGWTATFELVSRDVTLPPATGGAKRLVR
jgi:hypothetical protein